MDMEYDIMLEDLNCEQLLMDFRKSTTSKNDWSKLDEVFLKAMYKLKQLDPNEYKKLYFKLYEVTNDHFFNETLADIAVSNLDHGEDNCGEKVSYEDVTMLAKKYGIKIDNQNIYTIYFLINMMMTDYRNDDLEGEELERYYMKLTTDWLEDSDIASPSTKTFDYYKRIVVGV